MLAPKLVEALDAAIAESPGLAVQILESLVQIPSVNPWFESANNDNGERKMQEVLAQELQNLGAEVRLFEPDMNDLATFSEWPGYYPDRSFCGRPNLLARFPGNGKGRSLLLCGHVDVVPPGEGWSHPPFDAVIEEGKLYGRGAVDMKGGIAAILAAVKYIRSANVELEGDLIIATVVEEESGGMGMLALATTGIQADAGILAEPTGLEIAPLCRGILWGKICVTGRSGHIELPQPHWREGGAVDAIGQARKVLSWLDELTEQWKDRKSHPLLDEPCSIKVAQISGGHSPTSYADKAEIVFNAQYLPSERDENGLGSAVKEEVERWIWQRIEHDDWLRENPPKITWMVDADCAEVEATNEKASIVHAVLEQVEACLPDKQASVRGMGCHTDMGLLNRIGIPTINFGPGNPRAAHQVDESLNIAELQSGTKIFARTILSWCGGHLRKLGECDDR